MGSGQPEGTRLGKAACAICPHFPHRGLEGKQMGRANGVMGEASCSFAQPHPAPSLPTQAGVEGAHWSLGLLGSRLRSFKEPCFQHLLRGEAPRCESGIHLVGIEEGAAICCPTPPLHHLSPGRGLRGGVGSGGDIALSLAAPDTALDWGGSALALPGNRAAGGAARALRLTQPMG